MKILKFSRASFFGVCLLMIGSLFAQPNSDIYRYNNLNSNKLFMQTNPENSCHVICFNTSDDRSCFIVRNKDYSSIKHFYTTNPLPSGMIPGPNYKKTGYIINDMQATWTGWCFFCGVAWEETEITLYDPIVGGGIYVQNDTTRVGFIGVINIDSVLNGSGHMDIVKIPETKELSKITIKPGGVVGIGTLYNGNKSCIIESMIPHFTSTKYSYKIAISQDPSEIFINATTTDNKVVVLSRYSSLSNESNYKYRFGLRYGGYNDYINGNNTVQLYDVRGVFHDNRTQFDGVLPMCIAYPHVNNEVMVSYVVTANTSFKGNFLMFRIASESDENVGICYNQNGSYTQLKEMKYYWPNYPGVTVCKMFLLLKDSLDNSVIRFTNPNWNLSSSSDYVISSVNPKIESIAPFQKYVSDSRVAAAGYYPNNYNKIADFQELIETNSFSQGTYCSSHSLGTVCTFYNNFQNNHFVQENSQLTIYTNTKYGILEQIAFTSSTPTKTKKCENGTSY